MNAAFDLTLTALKCLGEGISCFADGKEVADHVVNHFKEKRRKKEEQVAETNSEEVTAE